jgi:nitroreductase
MEENKMFKKGIFMLSAVLFLITSLECVWAGSEITYSKEQDYLFNIFQNRRSVRSFKSTPVPEEHIQKILDIARCAPTSGNQQPWKFLVVQDRSKLDEMKEACINRSLLRYKTSGELSKEETKKRKERITQYYNNCFSAPLYIVVLVDKHSKYPTYNRYDGPMAAGYLMIAARALGYGTVFYTDSIHAEVTKNVLKIPDQFERVCITPVGVPEQWPTAPAKKKLEEFIVQEKFIKGVNYKEPVIRKAIKLEPKILDLYVGKYKLNESLNVTVTREKKKLYIQVTGQPKLEVFPETQNKFFLKVVDAQVTFSKNESGKITQLTIHQNGKDTVAQKIE